MNTKLFFSLFILGFLALFYLDFSPTGHIILAALPTHTTPTLNTTFGTNLTSENLTVSNQSTLDTDGDQVKDIITWYRNNASVFILNMPFEKWNNTDGNNTKDYSGNNYNATERGNPTNALGGIPIWNATGGYDGKGAYEFTGTTYLSLGTTRVLFDSTKPLTISFWSYLKATNGAQAPLNIRTDYSGDPFHIWFGDNGLNVGGRLNFARFRNTEPDTNYLNRWVHVVVTFDGQDKNTTSSYKLYVNGTLQTSLVYDGPVSSLPDENYIGRATTAGFFNGTIDDVMILNITLSPSQVRALYENKTNLMTSEITRGSDVWRAHLLPNDGTQDGTVERSNNITIIPVALADYTLNSTSLNNETNGNLSVFFNLVNGSDRAIINWYYNSTSLTLLNLAFEQFSENLSIIKDYSGYGNNFTVYGPNFNNSGGYDSNDSYSFDGLHDYMVSQINSTLTGNPAFSIETWIFIPNSAYVNGTPYRPILWWGINESMKAAFLGFQGTNTTRLFVGFPHGGSYMLDTLSVEKWHHIVWVRNASLNASVGNLLYVDGVTTPLAPDYNLSDTNLTPNIQSAPYYIQNGSEVRFFQGTIDNLRLYNRSLTAQQVTNLFQNKTYLLDSAELTNGSWKACVTPNDGFEDGQEKCLNMTIGMNVTNEVSSGSSGSSSSGGGGGGSSTSATVIVNSESTYTVTEEQLQAQEQNLAVKESISFTQAGSSHKVTVLALTETTATILVQSTPQEITLRIGETKQVNLNENDQPDLQITLEKITFNTASFMFKILQETFPTEESNEEQELEILPSSSPSRQESKKQSPTYLVLLIGSIIVVGITLIIYSLTKPINKKRK